MGEVRIRGRERKRKIRTLFISRTLKKKKKKKKKNRLIFPFFFFFFFFFHFPLSTSLGSPPLTSKMKLDYPATQRNKEVILEVLRSVLPPSGTVLELAGGSGQHALHFCQQLGGNIFWFPTDVDEGNIASQEAYRSESGLDNFLSPVFLDVTWSKWPVPPLPSSSSSSPPPISAMFTANLLHISPFSSTLGLLDGASRILPPGAPLIIYGPFMRGGKHTAPSNASFSSSLKQRNSEWGVRDLDVVEGEARERGLELEKVFEMPANNLTVVFRRC